MWFVKSQLSMFFLSVQYMISRGYFCDYLKMVIPPAAFKAFLRGSIFDKIAFSINFGLKKTVLVHQRISMHGPTKKFPLLQSGWSIVLSTMTIECEQFIYLFIYLQCPLGLFSK